MLHLDRALSLAELSETEDPQARAQEAMLSVTESLGEYPLLAISKGATARVLNGAGLRPQDLAECRWERPGGAGPVVLADGQGEALALGVFDGKASVRVKRLL